MKAFPIDFVRQILEQQLFIEHQNAPEKFFGGSSEVNLFSFYEQLQKESEVDRYTEMYRDLVNQQNRTGLIMNGTIIAPENPTITNLYNCLIVPMNFTCAFKVKLENRDKAIDTINNLIDKLKGRKKDVALLDNGKPFMVGNIGSFYSEPSVDNGDYVGQFDDTANNFGATFSNYLDSLETNYDIESQLHNVALQWYYIKGKDGKLTVVFYSESENNFVPFKTKAQFDAYCEEEGIEFDDYGLQELPIFPPEHNSFTKYKVSLSFDSIRCDEPRNLNADEYCMISFGGSATLVSNGVTLGNDLVKVGFRKLKIVGKDDITINNWYEFIEPLELPSNSNANTQMNQLISNKFLTNTHTDALNLSLQYSFIVDKNIQLVKEWFDYARYGTQADLATISSTKKGITPNMIYGIREYIVSWGEIEMHDVKAKIVETIEIENTESDTLTIMVPFQIQGDNN